MGSFYTQNHPHRALKIPEILHEIMAFLPKSDLLSATLINRGWEGQARKYLHARETINLDPTRIESYLKVCTVRSNFPRRLALSNFDFGGEASSLKNSTFISHIAELSLKCNMGGETAKFSNVINFLKSFPNLKYLGICFQLEKGQEILPNYSTSDSTSTNFSFVKVRKLYISVTTLRDQESKIDPILNILIPNILPLFPKITNIEWNNLPETITCQYILTKISFNNPFVKSLSFNNIAVPVPTSLDPGLFLTKFDFKIPILEDKQPYTDILRLFAGSLECIVIRGIHNIDHRAWNANYPLIIPILPQLKYLQVVLHEYMFSFIRSPNHEGPVTPWCYLKFETQDKCHQLSYPSQFPSLQKLSISKETSVKEFVSCGYKITEDEYFQAAVSFYDKHFLLSKNAGVLDHSCKTLRELDIPFPRNDKFILIVVKGGGSSDLLEWKESSQLFAKIVTTFPNAKGKKFLEDSSIFQRREMIQDWVKVGKELGFFVEQEQDDEKIVLKAKEGLSIKMSKGNPDPVFYLKF